MYPNQSHTMHGCLACLQCSHANNLQLENSPFSVKLSHKPNCLSISATCRWRWLMPCADILHCSHWSGPCSFLECGMRKHLWGEIQKYESHPWKWVQTLISFSISGNSSWRKEEIKKSTWIILALLYIILKRVEPIYQK